MRQTEGYVGLSPVGSSKMVAGTDTRGLLAGGKVCAISES